MPGASAHRASDADREAALPALRGASVEGWLTFAQSARTQRKLARVTNDLPSPGAPGRSAVRAQPRLLDQLAGSARRLGAELRGGPS